MVTARGLAHELAAVMLACLDESMDGKLPASDGPNEIKVTALLMAVLAIVEREPALAEFVIGASHGLSMAATVRQAQEAG